MRALIAAGGDPPGKEEFAWLRAHADLLIAADSGSDWLVRYGVLPDVLLGDFDSAAADVLAALDRPGVERVQVPVQKDDTDTMLAARVAVERGAGEVVLTGCLGGVRPDHTLANIHVLEWLRRRGARAGIAGSRADLYLVADGITLRGAVGDVVSLFPFMGEAEARLLEGGLQYPLSCVFDDVFCGVSNALTQPLARIAVTRGRLLVVHGHAPLRERVDFLSALQYNVGK